ncbi:MAG: CARDB domain-containing protein, partial [Methanobacteriaceae archaeon]|nr:CARDB domain-containing protein [Methanobacteriaceae archaeon]
DGSASIGIITVEEGLAIGHSTTLTWDWPITFGATGEHYLHLIVDTLDQQYESNETNNVLNQTISVIGRPDLVPSNLTTSGTIYTGLTYQVSVKITNKGDIATGTSFKVRLHDNGVLVGEKTVEKLNPNGYFTLNWDWTPLTAGTHVLEIVTDSLDQIYESNETNNNLNQTVNVNPVP